MHPRVQWAIARARSAQLLARKKDFDESQHPRDDHGRWTDGGGGDDGGGGGGASGGSFTSSSPGKFISGRNASTRQQYMSPLKPEDLSDHTLITTKDSKAGVAIDPKGDLQNLYNNGGPKGIGADLVAHAIGNGARTLDCFDGYLPNYYRQLGFEETGRMKFDPGQAPPGWDVNKDGQPDVVFMAWKGYVDGDEKAAIARAKSSEGWIKNDKSGTYETDYDKAKDKSRVAARREKDHRSDRGELRAGADRAGDPGLARTGEGSRQPVANRLDPGWAKRRVAFAAAKARSAVLLGRAGYDESEHPRDDHGRWTDSGGGDDGGGGSERPDKPAAESSKPVADYKPGARTPSHGDMKKAKSTRKEWADKSPLKTMDDAKRMALQGQTVLNGVARQIEKSTPGVRVDYSEDKFTTGLKGQGGGEARVREKADTKYGGQIAMVSDLARTSFVADSPEAADKIFAELANHFELVSEEWRKTPEQYGDRAANVRLPNGLIAEVQVLDKDMSAAKHRVHDDYKITRADGVDKNSQRYKDALQRQRDAYTEVLKNHPPEWKAVFDKAIQLRAWLKTRLAAAAADLGIASRKPLSSACAR